MQCVFTVLTPHHHPRHKPRTMSTPISLNLRTHPATPTPSLPRRDQCGDLLQQALATEQPRMGTLVRGPCRQTRAIVHHHCRHVAMSTMSLISLLQRCNYVRVPVLTSWPAQSQHVSAPPVSFYQDQVQEVQP